MLQVYHLCSCYCSEPHCVLSILTSLILENILFSPAFSILQLMESRAQAWIEATLGSVYEQSKIPHRPLIHLVYS